MDGSPLVPEAEVVAVRFYVAGGEPEGATTAEVVSTELGRPAAPARGGLMDPKMGAASSKVKCETCFQTRDCPGHRGTIVLNAPVIDTLFAVTVLHWLRLLCHECSALLLPRTPESRASLRVSTTLDRIRVALKEIKPAHRDSCWQCGAANVWKIAISEMDSVTVTRSSPSEVKPVEMPAEVVRRILAALPDEDAADLKVTPETHPSRMVLQQMPVLPVPMRLPHDKEGGRTVHDDLTTLQQMILQTNSAIAPDQAAAPDVAQMGLQQKLGTLARGLVRTSGEEEKSQSRMAKPMATDKSKMRIQAGQRGAQMVPLGARISGKHGHIRGTQMGRRAGYQARAVIANDPAIPLDCIKIPLLVARTLQVQEIVSPYNQLYLAQLLQNGTVHYPGCTQVVRRGGVSYNADAIPPDFVLEPGDTVLRDLVDGDFIMFNRMPSLEWSAGTTFKVLVDVTNSARYVILMNVHTCVLFNADFDGDQMNLWCAPGVASRAEISMLSPASEMLISPRDVKPRMGATYDSVVGGALLCLEEKISRWMAMMIAQAVPEPPRLPIGAGDPDADVVSGRDLVSGVLPPINLVMKTSMSNEKIAAHVALPESAMQLVIKDGRVLKGVLDKKTAGEGASNGVYHTIANRYGPEAALRAIFAVEQLSIGGLSRRGFTGSLGSLFVTPRGRARLRQIAAGVQAEIDELVGQLAEGRVVAPVGVTVAEFLEQRLLAAMEVHGDALAAVLETVEPANNGFFLMIATGAKGKPANYVAISGIGGAITVNARLNNMNGSHKRLYPWHQRFGYEDWGFCRNSILDGVTLHEMIEAARAGRFALIGKALLTSVAGEQYRNTAKNTEAVNIDHFGRLVEGRRVLANHYGNTGYDPRLLVEVKLAEYWASDKEFEALLALPRPATGALAAALKRTAEALARSRAAVRANGFAEEAGAHNLPMSERCVLPLNVKHLLLGLTQQARPPTDAELVKMLEAVERFAGSLAGQYVAPGQRARLPEHFRAASSLMAHHVRAALAPANLARANPEVLEHVLQTTAAAVLKALISPGTCVGTIAAQVFGEPFTQYMLDSMHNVAQGGTSRDVANAVKALLSASVNFRRAMYVAPAHGVPAQVVANHIELTRIRRFVARWQLFVEEIGKARHPAYAHENRHVQRFLQLNKASPPPSGLLHACLRIEIDRVVMMMRNTQIEEVAGVIMKRLEGTYVVWTSETAGGGSGNSDALLTLRVYVEASYFGRQPPTKQAFLALKDAVLDLPVHGVVGVQETKVFSMVRSFVAEDGAVRSRGVEMVETSGSNLRDILLNPEVDALNTITTSTWDAFLVFGAVAARRVVESGIVDAGGEGGADYYHGHRQIYGALIMTRGEPGTMLNGLAERNPNAVLLAASHKSALQIFSRAAANGTVDPCCDPAAATMVGQTPRIGTNYSRVAIDSDAMRRRFVNPVSVLDALAAES